MTVATATLTHPGNESPTDDVHGRGPVEADGEDAGDSPSPSFSLGTYRHAETEHRRLQHHAAAVWDDTPAHAETWGGASALRFHRGRKGKAKRYGGGIRGKVLYFSHQSRGRLSWGLQRLRLDVVPVFVTLTYPIDYPDPEAFRAHKKRFFARLDRRFPRAAWVWKLEFQRRGAPHLHLLVFGVPWSALRRWCAVAWCESGNLQSDASMVWGADVQRPREAKAVSHYVTKAQRGYVWKDASMPEGDGAAWGRFWGFRHPDRLPWGQGASVVIPARVAARMMRYTRRFAGLRTFASCCSLRLVGDPDQWGRLLAHELAEYWSGVAPP